MGGVACLLASVEYLKYSNRMKSSSPCGTGMNSYDKIRIPFAFGSLGFIRREEKNAQTRWLIVASNRNLRRMERKEARRNFS